MPHHEPERPTGQRAPTGAAPGRARFVTGSLLRHVFVMASTGAIGLVAVFAVDLINLFYISRLGEREIAAAIGFAGVVAFFHVSFAIGLVIGITAVVSRTIGAGRAAEARGLATSSLVLMAAICFVLGSGTMPFLQPILQGLGASGETERLAQRYLSITVHSLPLLGVGMACSALLRSVGDARAAMNVTLGSAIFTALLDPVFIFVLDLRLDGAAIVSLLARGMLMGIGLYGVVVKHKMLGRFARARLASDARRLGAVAAPAVLTNLATPVSAAFITHSIAQFGSAAVAGQATIDRVTPVAFGLIFALSGAIGPIFAQNLGAQEFGRVRETLRASLIFMVLAVGGAWLILALTQGWIVVAFSAEGPAEQLIRAFCRWIAAGFFFVGALFVANTAFNNLGRPLLSTGFNWARATLGTIPFAWYGSRYGPIGVLAGQMLGSAIFGSLALLFAFRLTSRLLKGVRPGDTLGAEMAELRLASLEQGSGDEPLAFPLPHAPSAAALAPLVEADERRG